MSGASTAAAGRPRPRPRPRARARARTRLFVVLGISPSRAAAPAARTIQRLWRLRAVEWLVVVGGLVGFLRPLLLFEGRFRKAL
mmetsp:Transcript_14859/g.56313  ORF Transcript_14859/g.56313 Transcript_14859/m.56313 type:complete len:84 (-) Transcript_14859:295-546(-)